MEHVLVASLGESPVVITAMYDLLTKQRGKHVDRLVVLYSKGGYVKDSLDLVKEAMKDQPCIFDPQDVLIEDTSTTRDCIVFLQQLYRCLTIYQDNGDVVYLSLAGGRKSMSALMAWVVPYFSCIKGLYHVIDKDERDFFTIEQIVLEMNSEQQKRAMHPEFSHLELVDIPLNFPASKRDEWRNELLSMSVEELEELQEENAQRAEALEFGRRIAQGERIIDVWLTAYAAKQFSKMCDQDVTHAQRFETCFNEMRSVPMLRSHSHGTFAGRDERFRKLVFHYFKLHRRPERPMFYTLPKDIKSVPDSKVDRVVVCSLEIEREREYRSVQEILADPDLSSLEPEVPLDQLPSIRYRNMGEGILIVPLGASPMVATQLYTLLRRQGQVIREVVLVYPADREIIQGAEIVKQALRDEDGTPCRHKRIDGLRDILSSKDCGIFQAALETEIDRVRNERSGASILLALSGGRKGMTALAMFSAIRKGIPRLFHTLIGGDDLEQAILKETSVEALRRPGLDRKTRNDRLFLRAYAKNDKELAERFTLFEVPVLLPSM